LVSNPFEEVRGQRKIAYIYVYQKKYSKGDEIIEKYKGKYPKEGGRNPTGLQQMHNIQKLQN